MAAKGFFGIGVYHPKYEQNIGTLFRSAVVFGAAFVFTVGRRYDKQASDTVGTSSVIPLYHYPNLDALIEHLPHGCPLVGVELVEGVAQPLDEYQHHRKACYLLGAEDHGLPERCWNRCHELVVVPGAAECLNVASAGSIVIYDRFAKQAQNEKLQTAGH